MAPVLVTRVFPLSHCASDSRVHSSSTELTVVEAWVEVSSQGGRWEFRLDVKVVDDAWKWAELKNCPQVGVTDHSIFLGCRLDGLD